MNKCSKGFSLAELMVVIAIVAIMLVIATPSYKYLTTSYRMSAEVNNLLGDMQFAREEALKEGSGVTVCESTTGTSCGGASNWNTGWIVFSDPNVNQKVDAGERVLKVQGAFTGVTPDAFNASGAVSAVTFNREGFASTSAGFVTTTMILTDPTNNNAYTRCLLISAVGMLSSQNAVANPTTC
jgi:type IV fimbrial biogenesis protein FimT